MARLLAGRRPNAPKSPATSHETVSPLPTKRSPDDPKVHSKPGYCSRQSFVMLVIGVMAGYVLLPVFLIETKLQDAFDRLPSHGTGTEEMSERTPAFSMGSSTRGSSVASSAGIGRSLLPDANDALNRLMEDRAIMQTQSLPTFSAPEVMHTKTLPDHHRKKILITGGAGFVGSHLVDKLMMQGHEVIVVDNFFTGQKKNVAHWLHHPNFRYVAAFWLAGLVLSFISLCSIYFNLFLPSMT